MPRPEPPSRHAEVERIGMGHARPERTDGALQRTSQRPHRDACFTTPTFLLQQMQAVAAIPRRSSRRRERSDRADGRAASARIAVDGTPNVASATRDTPPEPRAVGRSSNGGSARTPQVLRAFATPGRRLIPQKRCVVSSPVVAGRLVRVCAQRRSGRSTSCTSSSGPSRLPAPRRGLPTRPTSSRCYAQCRNSSSPAVRSTSSPRSLMNGNRSRNSPHRFAGPASSTPSECSTS